MGIRTAIVTVATVVLLGGCNGAGGDAEPAEPAETLDAVAAEGKQAFEARCAQCHGQDLRGTRTGPPLLHEVYAPDHHPDESFFNAVENGVQPHHWEFGPMPPINGVSRDEIAAIVRYVRAVQEREGLSSGS